MNPYETTPTGQYPFSTGKPAYARVPGKGLATAGLVLGIVSAVLAFLATFILGRLMPFLNFDIFAIIFFIVAILGAVGLICSICAKRAGFAGDMRAAGFLLSLVGLYHGLGNTLFYLSFIL